MTADGQVDAMPAAELQQERQKCTLGCPILDKTLNGGIPCGSVTEFVGENASAKTQLCLQLLLTVQLPVTDGGLNGSALYIYTEGYFASSRLQQLAKAHSSAGREEVHRFGGKATNCPSEPVDEIVVAPTKSVEHIRPRVRSLFDEGGQPAADGEGELATDGGGKPATDQDSVTLNGHSNQVTLTRNSCCVVASDPCRNVYVQGLETVDEMLAYLDRAKTLLSHPLRMPVRLLVIDSITALFRSYYENGRLMLSERSDYFFKISSKLKMLAEEYDLAVVISNQVSDYFEPRKGPCRDPAPGSTPRNSGSEILKTSGRRVVPALGIAWAHCVNTRLFLSRANYGGNNIRRSMQVVFAPHLPNVSCDFLVDAGGVKGVTFKRRLEDSDPPRQSPHRKFVHKFSIDGDKFDEASHEDDMLDREASISDWVDSYDCDLVDEDAVDWNEAGDNFG